MKWILFLMLMCTFAFAFAPLNEQQNYTVWDTPEYSETVPIGSHEILSQFTGRYGSHWHFIWNPETGLPHRIIGEGISVGDPVNADDAVEICLDFAAKNENIFPPQCTLEPISVRNAMNTWIIVFREKYEDLPVLTGRADFRIKKGKLVLIGSDLNPRMDVDTEPRISTERAEEIALQEFSFSSTESRLCIFPQDGGKLLWHISAQNEAPVHRYHILIDAYSEAIIWWWDEIPTFYGDVSAMVHPLYEIDSIESVPISFMWIYSEMDDSALSNDTGTYLLDIPFVDSMLIFCNFIGLYADVTPVSGVHSACGGGAVEEHFDLHFNDECPGVDETGGFYHVNVVHSYFKMLDPDYTAMDYPVPVRVSDTISPCPTNAFWDGYGIHLGAGDGTHYRNFGLYADVVYHEYTHGVTHYIYPDEVLPYSGQPGAMDEAFSDYFPCAITGEPYIGEAGLVIGMEWMRSLDNDLVYPDDWEGEVHADSRIISGAWWEIREDIPEHEWADSLVHFTRFTLANSFDDFAYEMLILDDDDGDISNGTPHDTEIMQAYMRHGIGGFGIKISHEQLRDTEDTTESYRIRAEIETFASVDSFELFYSTDDGETFIAIEMAETDTDNVWEEFIPAVSVGTTIHYYLFAKDLNEFMDYVPQGAPDSLFSFYVGWDTIAPKIMHKAIWDRSEYAHPFQVKARIFDNGIEPVSALIVYGKNDGSDYMVDMTYSLDDDFYADIEFDDSVAVGDSIWYSIVAADGATIPNYTMDPESGYYSFRIVRSIFSDFEGEDGGFSSYAGWEWGAPTHGPDGACSGEFVWATMLDRDYDNEIEWLLESSELDITDFSAAILRFHMWLESERRYDGGQVLIRTDGGAPELIEPIDGYSARIIAALGGEPGYSGYMDDWKHPAFDLSAYVGHTISIQYRFASDAAVTGAGWYIDDFAILETSFLISPKNFRAESGHDEMIPLFWESPSAGVDTYRLFKSTVPTMPDTPLVTLTTDDVEYEDYDVINEVTYFYWLVACYDRGDSEPAGPVEAMAFNPVIFVTPGTLDVSLPMGGVMDTILDVHNMGLGNLIIDIFELPIEEDLHYAPAYGEISAVAEAVSHVFTGGISYAVTDMELTEPDPEIWHLLDTDPMEGAQQDIALFWGQIRNTGSIWAYFRIAGYESFGDPDSFAIAFMLDTDRNPMTGYIEGGGIEYMVAVAHFSSYEGMILEYNPLSPYEWDIIGPPGWIYHSLDEDTIEVGFTASNIGSPVAAYTRCAAMVGLTGMSPEIIDLAPDTTEMPVEFFFYDASWLSANPLVDTIPGDEYHDINVDISSLGLPLGDYSAYLQFKSNDLSNPNLRVPVTLHIVSGIGEFRKPDAISMGTPYPSPFNSVTQIKFTIPFKQDVRLDVCDVAGKCVRELFTGRISSGEYSLQWRGIDDDGNNLPSGIFFIRLASDDGVCVCRTAIIR